MHTYYTCQIRDFKYCTTYCIYILHVQYKLFFAYFMFWNPNGRLVKEKQISVFTAIFHALMYLQHNNIIIGYVCGMVALEQHNFFSPYLQFNINRYISSSIHTKPPTFSDTLYVVKQIFYTIIMAR